MDWQPRRLEAWVKNHIDISAPIEVSAVSRGYSNENFLISSGEQRWLLRKSPVMSSHQSAHNVLREFSILAALDKTPVRIPKLLTSCEDRSVIGTPFFIADWVEGVVLEQGDPPLYTLAEDRFQVIIAELIDALTVLHKQDWKKLRLSDLGQPTAFLEGQIERWWAQHLAQVRSFGDELHLHTSVETIADWLRLKKPADRPPKLIHGDFQLSNIVFSHQPPPRALAILDWELATLGDPLLDLASLLLSWLPYQKSHAESRCPTVDVLADLYFQTMSEEPVNLNYYLVLAAWKRAIILASRYANLQRRQLSQNNGRDKESNFSTLKGLIHGYLGLAEQWTVR